MKNQKNKYHLFMYKEKGYFDDGESSELRQYHTDELQDIVAAVYDYKDSSEWEIIFMIGGVVVDLQTLSGPFETEKLARAEAHQKVLDQRRILQERKAEEDKRRAEAHEKAEYERLKRKFEGA